MQNFKRSEGQTLARSFSRHGRASAAAPLSSMSTTYKAKYREPLRSGVPGVEFVRFNDIAEPARRNSQMKSTLFSSNPSRAAAASVRSRGVFLRSARLGETQPALYCVVDEIQSGMGRAGKWCRVPALRRSAQMSPHLPKPLAEWPASRRCAVRTGEVARLMHAGMHAAQLSVVVRWLAPSESPSLTPLKRAASLTITRPKSAVIFEAKTAQSRQAPDFHHRSPRKGC